MRLRLFAVLIISVMLLSSCVSEVVPVPLPTPEPSPMPALTPEPTSPPSPIPPALPAPTSQLPLNVAIHYIGVKSNQAVSGAADVYLLLVVTDGYRKAERFLPTGGTFSLNNYQTIELNQTVFHTDSAGDSLKVCILAYKQNDPRWLTSILTPALAEIERGLAWADYRSAKEILATIDKHMARSTVDFINGGDQLIGYYEDVWGTNQFLGIGDYNGVGSDDFRLWFSIWSTEQPKPPPQSILLPDVTLDNINMVSTASTGQTRTDIIRIGNKEPHPVSVTLNGASSKRGDFYNNTIEVPAKGYAWVENDVVCKSPGINIISYDLYFWDSKLDSWSKELRVISDLRQISLVEWRSAEGYSLVERKLDGALVTLYVEAPGYTGVKLAASIRRVEPDGSYRYEETIDITIINGLGLGRWKAKWQSVLEGDPTYVFGVKDIYSNELTVVKKYEVPPDVGIDDVDMVSYVNAGEVRTDTITIKSNESELVVVRLKGYSSVDGEFYNSAVSIPAEGDASVEVQSSWETPGIRTITYKLYHQGAEFDSWSGVLEVF